MARRTTRWIFAAIAAIAFTAGGCARARAHEEPLHTPARVTADDSLVHAFDTQMEVRLLDRLELDNFLRERDIRVRVVDGAVSLSGAVWTPLERERVAELIRGVPGVIDVANDLDIRPPL
jgi:osmotically-inducible protein OsmY